MHKNLIKVNELLAFANNSEGVSSVIPKLTDQIILFTVNQQGDQAVN